MPCDARGVGGKAVRKLALQEVSGGGAGERLTEELKPLVDEGAGRSPAVLQLRFGGADAQAVVEDICAADAAGLGNAEKIREGDEDSAVQLAGGERRGCPRRREGGARPAKPERPSRR